jgi:hypothetical protein
MPLVVWKLDRLGLNFGPAHRQIRTAQDPLRIARGAFRPINAPPQTLNFPLLRCPLEQIKFLLGHSSIQTTERYLGSVQDIAVAVNDGLGF